MFLFIDPKCILKVRRLPVQILVKGLLVCIFSNLFFGTWSFGECRPVQGLFRVLALSVLKTVSSSNMIGYKVL